MAPDHLSARQSRQTGAHVRVLADARVFSCLLHCCVGDSDRILHHQGGVRHQAPLVRSGLGEEKSFHKCVAMDELFASSAECHLSFHGAVLRVRLRKLAVERQGCFWACCFLELLR